MTDGTGTTTYSYESVGSLAARSAATMLVTALGQRLGEFVALLDKADPWMVRVALREMKPVPAAAEAGNEAHQIDNGLQPPLPVPPPHAKAASISSLVV